MKKLLIIGAGPGGYETAVEAAARGFSVTIFNAGQPGGTCLNEGCIPTKTFCAAAHAFRPGVDKPDAFLAALQERKAAVVEQLRSGVMTLLKHPNIEYVPLKAQFVAPKRVRAGEREWEGDAVIIASGSVSASLPISGAEYCLDSSRILELDNVPSRLGIIGGGVIGLEFASIFAALGSEVTVFEYCKNILPRFDADIAKRLRQSLAKRGIRILTGACVQKIGSDGSLSYSVGEAAATEFFSKILMAVGRVPCTDGLKLEAAGLEMTKQGIPVDENMQTAVPGIYAIGDVTGGMMLAHTAKYQGLRALNALCGFSDNIDFSVTPAVVFTEPELATVGRSEEELKAGGIAFKAHKAFYRANGKAVSEGASDGLCKLLVDEEGRILGAHILGAHAADLIHEAAALIALGVPVSRARDLIHAHPSFSEILAVCYGL